MVCDGKNNKVHGFSSEKYSAQLTHLKTPNIHELGKYNDQIAIEVLISASD